MEDKYWTATYTVRGHAIRIISVRRSREKEVDLYDRKWKVDRDQISKKMLRLNRWETLCLELWARSFWLTGTAGELEAFEQYAEPLAQRA